MVYDLSGCCNGRHSRGPRRRWVWFPGQVQVILLSFFLLKLESIFGFFALWLSCEKKLFGFLWPPGWLVWVVWPCGWLLQSQMLHATQMLCYPSCWGPKSTWAADHSLPRGDQQMTSVFLERGKVMSSLKRNETPCALAAFLGEASVGYHHLQSPSKLVVVEFVKYCKMTSWISGSYKVWIIFHLLLDFVGLCKTWVSSQCLVSVSTPPASLPQLNVSSGPRWYEPPKAALSLRRLGQTRAGQTRCHSSLASESYYRQTTSSAPLFSPILTATVFMLYHFYPITFVFAGLSDPVLNFINSKHALAAESVGWRAVMFAFSLPEWSLGDSLLLLSWDFVVWLSWQGSNENSQHLGFFES